MLGFGRQTVTCLHYELDGVDDLGTLMMTPTRTDVHGCLHQPKVPTSTRGGGEARAEQGTEVGVTVATSWYRTTTPPDPAVLELLPSDALEVDGEIYQIIGGIHPFRDATGKITHVAILSEKQTIG